MASITSYETTTGKRRYAVRWRENGKPRWRSVPGPKRNAEKVRREIEERLALGHLYVAEPETLAGYLRGWFDRYGRRVRPSTLRRRREAVNALALPDAYMHQLSLVDVEDAIAATATRQAQIGLQTLKMALRDAARRGQRFDEGILELKPPRSEEREPRFLTWPEVEQVQSWMPEGVARIVPVAALTGMRQGELLALVEDDVDLGASTVQVRGGKTKAARRSVDLPATAVTLLREQLVARPHTGALVFPAPRGGQWERNRFMGRAFRPAAKRAGLEGVTFHDLRHTAASLMIAAGWHVKAIAEQLGHADGGALVLRRYGHLYAGARREAAAGLDAFIQDVHERMREAGA